MDKYTAPHFETSALITIDTQNDFSLDNAPARIPGTMDIIPNMAGLLDYYRKMNRLIVHVVRLYLPDGSNADLCRRSLLESGKSIVSPGTQGAELVSLLKPDSSVSLEAERLIEGKMQQIGTHEFVMYKPRWGAFYKTQLESFLKTRDINTLVFTGCNFPNCPRTSIYQASERDFRIAIVKDALSGMYERGEIEMKNIGAVLMTAQDILQG